ncbi:MAG: hypothetical protein ACI9FW_001615 [Flavobacterium sp.]
MFISVESTEEVIDWENPNAEINKNSMYNLFVIFLFLKSKFNYHQS